MLTRFFEKRSDDDPITSTNLLSTVKDESVILQEGLEIVIDNKRCSYVRFKIVKVQLFVMRTEHVDKLRQEVFVKRIFKEESNEE